MELKCMGEWACKTPKRTSSLNQLFELEYRCSHGYPVEHCHEVDRCRWHAHLQLKCNCTSRKHMHSCSQCAV